MYTLSPYNVVILCFHMILASPFAHRQEVEVQLGSDTTKLVRLPRAGN
jgi:hypothetical protein